MIMMMVMIVTMMMMMMAMILHPLNNLPVSLGNAQCEQVPEERQQPPTQTVSQYEEEQDDLASLDIH